MSANHKRSVSRRQVWFLLALWLGGQCTLATPSVMALTIIRQHIPSGQLFEFDGLQVKAAPPPIASEKAISSKSFTLQLIAGNRPFRTIIPSFGWSPRPYSKFVIPIDANGHLRLHGALMDPSLLPGQRKLISPIDILAIAEMGGFSDLSLNPDEYKTVTSLEGTGQAETGCPHHPSMSHHHR